MASKRREVAPRAVQLPRTRLISYAIKRDFGFAPNPFFGFCTLATCKAKIRKTARAGDWVVGTGAGKRGDRLIFAMQVSEALDFDAYWNDPRFRHKRPNLLGSLKQMYGDNIYHQDPVGTWHQADSHHSLEGGVINPANSDSDLDANRVLIGTRFAYWGGDAPPLPEEFRGRTGIKAGRGHRSKFSDEFIARFLAWLVPTMGNGGCIGDPTEWRKAKRRPAQLPLFVQQADR